MIRALALAVLLAFTACSREAEKTATESLGADLSLLALQTLEGQPFKIPTDKPVVLNVWATWCAPCLKELPSLYELQKQGKYTVVAVAVDREAATVRNQLKELKVEGLNTAWDVLGKETRAKLAANQLPQTYISGPDLKVVAVEKGERDWAHPSMVARIEWLLQESARD